MTLYKIVETWGEAINVIPLEVPDLFDEDGRLKYSPSLLYQSEAMAVSHVGLRLSLEQEEAERRSEIRVKELERMKARLETLLNTPVETAQ